MNGIIGPNVSLLISPIDRCMAARSNDRRAGSALDPYHDRRVRYRAVLAPLGLWDLFTAMNSHAQQSIFQKKLPDWVVVYADSVPPLQESREMRRQIERGVREETFDYKGTKLTGRDFVTVYVACKFVVQFTYLKVMPPDVRAWMEKAGPILDGLYDQYLKAAMNAIGRGIMCPLCAHSQFESRIFQSTLEYAKSPSGKMETRVIVSTKPPESRQISFDGSTRPMYRVSKLFSGSELKWISWGRKELGFHHKPWMDKKLPVFVQSHAFKQLKARASLPGEEMYLEAWLGESLAEPVIMGRIGNELLVSFDVVEKRVGYLLVTLTGTLAIVRTFIFLTMEPSPEAQLLKEHLNLTREEVEWLGLHKLSAFTNTDMKNDPKLRHLMRQCACGHLFDLVDSDHAPTPKAFAEELKQYIGLAA